MPGLFSSLEHYLRGLAAQQLEITINFDDAENILNSKLPSLAYQNYAWWANQNENSLAEAQPWLETGWRVETVNFQDKWVRFVRV